MDPRKLTSWCKDFGGCKASDIEFELVGWVLKFAFFSWLPNLPVDMLGTAAASFVMSYESLDGYNAIMNAVFGGALLIV